MSTPNDWISLELDFPKEHEEVLFYGAKIGRCFGHFNPHHAEFVDAEGEYEINDVTHWMPLPNVPKEA